MKLKFMVFISLIIILFAPAYARLPERGDHVQVMTPSGLGAGNVLVYEGNVTGLDRGFLCLNCTRIDNPFLAHVNMTPPIDVCIGTGTILSVTWPDVDGQP
jgi:hypothetical protein